MTDAARARVFSVAAIAAEILGWIVLLGGSHVILGIALIVGGTLLWAGVPAMVDTRPGRALLTLGLQSNRERVRGSDSIERPDNNEMQLTRSAHRQRKRGPLADDGGREIALRHVDQHALAQLDALEVLAIGAQRLLRIGAGFGIVEEGARHPASGKLPQILDAGHGAHMPVILAASGGANGGTSPVPCALWR